MIATRSSNLILAACLSLLVLACSAAACAEDVEYFVQTTLQVGGDGGFDFATIDAEGKRLYLPRSSHTQVVDTADGKVLADIPDNSRSHGVALVPGVGRGFISNGGNGNVQIFDLKSNTLLGKVKAADDADGIIYDPASNFVLVMCGDAHALVAISPDADPKDGKSSATVDLGGKPEFGAADGHGKVFVNLVDKDEVAVVDSNAMKVIAKWPIAPAKQPVGMSIDPAKKRLYVGCRSKAMIVMSAVDGHILADLPIGEGVDATAFRDGTAFASCRDGTLTVIRETSPDKFEVVQTVKTAPRAKTMAVEDKTGAIYLPTADGQGRSITPGTFRVLVVGHKDRK